MTARAIRLLTAAAVLMTAANGCTTPASNETEESAVAPVAAAQPVVRPMMNFDQNEWTSFDGATFPFRHWTTQTDSTRAVVIAVHGLNGSAQDFDNLANLLSKHGVATLAYEMRGQGNDPEPKRVGDIRRANDWRSDLYTFLALTRQAHPNKPVFLFGESLGALITVHSVTQQPELAGEIAGLMLASPVVTLQGKIGVPKQLALQVGALVIPRHQVPFADFTGKPADELMVTSDASLEASSDQTPWLVSEFSLRFIANVGRMVNRMIPLASRITSPTLVLSGHKDVVMTPTDINRFVSALPQNLTTHRDYPEGHHLLLYDQVSSDVIKDTCSWLVERIEELEKDE